MAVMIDDEDDPATDDAETDPGMDTAETPVGDGFFLDETGVLTGSDQGDALTREDLANIENGDILDPVEDTETLERIDAGAGDDVIDLLHADDAGQGIVSYASSISDIRIDAGAGDDTIQGFFENGSVVDGGGGDDSIFANAIESQINGGAGADVIDISEGPTTIETNDDGTTTVHTRNAGWDVVVDGGEGDDVIIAANHSSAALNGGAGNDTIRTGGGLSFLSANHVVTVDGGDGNDVIEYDVFTNVHTFELVDQSALGGSGLDLFSIRINEGGPQIGDPCAGDDAPCDGYVNGHAAFTDEATLRVVALSLPDFEPGVDLLSLDTSPLNDGYELTEMTLDESEDGTSTDLILTYERTEDVTRNVVVRLGSGGVTWDDIELEAPGDVTLTPLDVTISEDGQTFAGSSGPETVTPEDPDRFYSGLDLHTGDGNDTIEGLKHRSSDVSLGAGDDRFSGSVDSGMLDLGEGNDFADLSEEPNPRIIQEGGGFSVPGGASFGFVLDAGNGDDYIDASNVGDGEVYGGPGDDVIIAGGFDNADGTGFVMMPDGGTGNDTIRYAVTTEVSGVGLEGQSALGGEGADRFEITINEGRSEIGEPLNGGTQVNSGAYYTEDGALRVNTLHLQDFEPGVDTLRVEATTQNNDYTLSGAVLEDASDMRTNLVLVYESEEAVTREISVMIAAPDVSWSDVEIVDEAGRPVDLVA